MVAVFIASIGHCWAGHMDAVVRCVMGVLVAGANLPVYEPCGRVQYVSVTGPL